MKSSYDQESLCELNFRKAGECWHLWTDEDHPIIFSSKEDFMAGMNIFGIAAKLFPDIKIYTFELMSNHIHVVASGNRERLQDFFEMFKKLLRYFLNGGRYSGGKKGFDLSLFKCNIRQIENLYDLRNVIAYDNRNGYLISPDETPFSYPWGANRYYFNPDIAHIAANCRTFLTSREKLTAAHSHAADGITPIRKVYGYACPLDFCCIDEGESFFRGASQYFHIISKSVESFGKIAKEISERIFYTDDELYTSISARSMAKFNKRIDGLDRNEKTELVKMMHYDFNAGNKQIARTLKLPMQVVDALFPPRP